MATLAAPMTLSLLSDRPYDGPAVEALGIVKRWRAGLPPVLDTLDLTVEPGELVQVVGSNGVGKTTLLRVLAGLIEPESGEVRLRGLEPRLDRREYQRRLALISAGDRGLYARLSPREHLEYWARVAMLPRSQRRGAVAAAIGRFSLEELAERRVDRLSMGQRQRVRLAMTFMHQPFVVLLDEPRTSLDEEGVQLLVAAVREVTDRGGAAIWCAPKGESQGIDFDRSLILSHGRLGTC
jgi:heme ABC exporter ATP-binding subunit CcmA